MMMDSHGNMFTQDKNGTKIVDPNGNLIELNEEMIQILGSKAMVVNVPSVNIKAGGVEVGNLATDDVIKGTTYLAWWKSVFLIWLNTHIHPTGVGPSGPAITPMQAPVDAAVLTKKLKVE